MLKFLNKILGGNKSEKDVKKIEPQIEKINNFFNQYQSLTNDELRGKTTEFRQRIQDHLKEINDTIAAKKTEAEALPEDEMITRDTLYKEVDDLKKDRDKKIEEALDDILPEAFAVVKETARRFKENEQIISTATQLDRDLSVKKQYI
ncbi:MAG: preprotein translocase subunit SecA, partial [Parafilimonas sp.]